jgi:hypothetical protein
VLLCLVSYFSLFATSQTLGSLSLEIKGSLVHFL